MPDRTPSAANTTSREPDREAILRAALSWVEESTNGERHRQRGLLALDSLLAELDDTRHLLADCQRGREAAQSEAFRRGDLLDLEESDV